MAIYSVKSGDTLGAIATRFKTTVSALAKTNHIKDVNELSVGQKLVVPDTYTGAANAAVPQKDLKRGAEGSQVKLLQQALVKLKHMTSAEYHTGPGIFGPRTEEAVKEFQAKHGISATGVYGPTTRAALAKALAAKPPTTTPTTPSTGGAPKKPATTWIASPNYSQRTRKIDTIVLHHTGPGGLSGTVNTFKSSAAQVSAHYVIGRDGKIVQMVKDQDKAWHAGTSAFKGKTDINQNSIGIEIVNDGDGKQAYTEAQYKALEKLLPYLSSKYKIPTGNLTTHKAIATPKGRKVDPSSNFDFKRAQAAMNPAPAKPKSTPPTTVSAALKDAEADLKKLGYAVATPDGKADAKTTAALKAFQAKEKLKVTGTLDAATDKRLDLRADAVLGPKPQGTAAKADWYRSLVTANKGHWRTGVNEMNIVGLRGESVDGKRHGNAFNQWNDTLAFVWKGTDGKMHVREFRGTTDPGQKYGDGRDANGDGVLDIAHLRPGSYPYHLGTHHGVSGAGNPNYNLPVFRDTNHDGQISAAEEAASKKRGDVGYAINLHWGDGATVGGWSLGCQVVKGSQSFFQSNVTPLMKMNRGQMYYTLIDRSV